VIAFRRGLDARTIPAIRIPGEATRGDRGPMVAKLAEILSDKRPTHKVAMMFVDSAYGAPFVERLRSMGFTNVQEVNFGANSLDRHMCNMRSLMWHRLREWLLRGAIPSDTVLESDLVGPGYHMNTRNKLVLESKQDMVKRGIASPDNADALALTFAAHVAPVAAYERPLTERLLGGFSGSWMG
jgi:hypothetical protein